MICLITDEPHGLTAHIGLTAHTTRAIHIPAGKADTILPNILLCINSGVAPSAIAHHVREHYPVPESKCHICALEGRILRAQGRKSVTAEEKARASSAAHNAHAGTVQIRRFRPGISGDQLSAMLKRGASPREITAQKPNRHTITETVMSAWDMI